MGGGRYEVIGEGGCLGVGLDESIVRVVGVVLRWGEMVMLRVSRKVWVGGGFCGVC